MKTRNLFAATLIAAIAFTSCSQDDDIGTSRKEVKIVASVGASTDNRTRASFQSDGSGEFEVGDVYALQRYNPTLGTTISEPYEIGSTTLYWDEVSWDGSPIDFCARYPVCYGVSSELYKVAGATSLEAMDLLMTPVVTVAKYDQVDLQFKHVMHKLTVTLSANHHSSAEMDNAVITLRNLKSDAMVDFNNGTVDETAALGTDAYAPATGSKAEFIVAPQDGLTTGTDLVKIEVAGKTYMYKVPGNLTILESGKHLTLTLTLKEGGGGVTGDIYIGEDFTAGGGHGGWN